ncbi:MAG: hypothetical protein KDD56_09445, partial [Bdellovibrionales bacterium]|nr:hypothetical protein [Bdellovibrionales bacterium]
MNEQISEKLAVEFAGVSASTLRRFAEAGYLEVDDFDSPTYSKNEICSLFGIPSDKPLPKSNVVELDFEDNWNKGDSKEKLQAIDFEETDDLEENEVDQDPLLRQGSGGQEDQDQELVNLKPELPTDDNFELDKSKKVIDLQEKILEMKDKEIADLVRERDWLRSRIEKLEEKADRDQLLMLNEMQTVREILVMQQHRQNKSPLRAALEWL